MPSQFERQREQTVGLVDKMWNVRRRSVRLRFEREQPYVIRKVVDIPLLGGRNGELRSLKHVGDGGRFVEESKDEVEK